ncbi:MAG: hypothetical protein JNL64_11470 [Blastocatellia bacterium]|nr:hypothetical protein [Blastocatellia bacterium]
MSNFRLKLDRLILPNFGKNQSRKNFRLVFDISYFTDDEKPKIGNSLVILPAEYDWQWRDKSGDKYLPPKDETVDPVELDLTVMDDNLNGFSKLDRQILLFQGKKVDSIKIKIFDVKEKTFGDALIWVAKNVLPTAVAGALSAVTGTIGSKFVVSLITELNDKNELSSALVSELTKKFGSKAGDKVLFNGAVSEDDVKPGSLKIKGEGKWRNDDRRGQYEVYLNLSEFTV